MGPRKSQRARLLQMILGSVEGSDKIWSPFEFVSGAFVGCGEVEGMHVRGQLWQVLKQGFVEAAPCVDVLDGFELVNGGDAKGGEDVVRWADESVLQFDSIDLSGGRENANFLR